MFHICINFAALAFPGWVCTDLLRNWPGITGNALRAVSRVLFKSPDDGSQTVVFCAVGDKMRDMSGKIFENCKVIGVKKYAKDPDNCFKLWNLSLHLCGLESEVVEEGEEKGHGVKVKDSKKVEEIGATNVETKKDQ